MPALRALQQSRAESFSAYRHASRSVTQHLVKRYRIADPLASQIVSSAWRQAKRLEIEPLLVLAIIGIESSHDPRAVSSEGAQGLMQVMPRFHLARLRALRPHHSLFDPDANIEVGVDLLQELLHKSQGNMPLALQRFNGACRDPEKRYAYRVLAEMAKLYEASSLTRGSAWHKTGRAIGWVTQSCNAPQPSH